MGNKASAPHDIVTRISNDASRHSCRIVQQGASLEPLIDVNKSMMAGLAQRPSA